MEYLKMTGQGFFSLFRAHNIGNIRGTILGLNIVLRYVNLMNGKIDFNSGPVMELSLRCLLIENNSFIISWKNKDIDH